MKIRNSAAIVCAMVLISAGIAQAQLTWDANGTGAGQSNGGGAWLGANLWWNGTANQNWVSGSDAVFGGTATAAGAVTLASPTTVNSLTLSPSFTGTYTLGTAGQTITLNNGITKNASSAAVTIISPITLGGAQSWLNNSATTLKASAGLVNGGNLLTVDGSGTVDFSGTASIITGTGGITKNGSGILILGGGGTAPAHNYSGTTTINGGTIRFISNASANSNITINDGVYEDYWTATFTRTLGSNPGQIQILGGTSGFSENGATGMTLTLNNNAAFEVVWGSAFFNPSTLVLQAASAQSGSGLTFSNKIDLNGTTRTVQVNQTAGTVSATISGAIRTSTGTAGLTKTGAGILLLSNAANVWNGDTVISQGWMDLAGMSNANLGGGSGRNVTVAAGAGIRFNALSNAFLNRMVETTDEITVMTGTTANNLDFGSSAGANLPQAFLGNWASNGAKMEYSGTLTPASDNYRLGGKYSSGLIGIVGANKLTGTQGLIVGGTGASGIRVELAAAQNFSGDTVINTSARLSLGNNLALQNSTLDVGAAGGNFSLAAGNNAGKITGETAAPSPTFGGLKGSRNLLTVFSATGGNNETLLASTAVTGFTLNVGTGKTVTYSGAIGGFGTGGASTLTKTGDGTQILSGNNTYSGATTISAGTLQLGDGGASGALGSGAVQNDATLVFNRSDTFTVANLMAGSGQLEKAGSGTLILAAANTYSGSTTISDGTLIGMVGGGCENSDLTINDTAGCTLGVAVNDNTKQWTCASLTCAGTSATLAFGIGTTLSASVAPLKVTGDLMFTGIPGITLDASLLTAGTYPLIEVVGSAPAGIPTVTITGASGTLAGTAAWSSGTLSVTITGASYEPLTWNNGNTGTWDVNNTTAWKDSSGATAIKYQEAVIGDQVQFTDNSLSAAAVITLNTIVNPAAVAVNNSVRDITISGTGAIGGSTGLTKSGSKALTLSTANSYTGGTTLNGGTLTAGANANLGADGSIITFAGNATLATTHSGYPVFAKGVAVNSGVTASLNPGSQYYKMTFTGPLSGNGTLDFNTGAGGAGSDLTFSSDANTFTGKVLITMSGNAGGGLIVNSLADGANPIQLKGNANSSIFKLGAGTASPLLFNSRRIELNGTLAGGGTIENNNATVGNTIAINTDLLVSATGNKTLTLGGSNAGANTFAGKIVDGTGAVISLIKAGTGKWTLSGANTFSGTTTVSDGTLVLATGTCLSDTAALSIASGKVVQIETGVKEKVGSLKLNNVTQAAGIYGSTTSAAPPANRSAYFSGTGLLYVGVDLPPLGTFIRIM